MAYSLALCTGLTAPVRYRSNFLPFCTPCPFFRGLGYVFRGGRVDLPLSLQGAAPVQPHKKKARAFLQGTPREPVAGSQDQAGPKPVLPSQVQAEFTHVKLQRSPGGLLILPSPRAPPPRQFDSVQFVSGIPTPNYSNWLSSILRYGVAIPSASSQVPAIMEWVDGNFTDDMTRSGTMFGEL